MAKYLVHLNSGMSQVVISLDGYGPTESEGLKELGSFELDVDASDAQLRNNAFGSEKRTDHPFIVEARKLLQEHLGEHNSTQGFTFLDRATNAVVGENEDTTGFSTNDLPGTEGGRHPDTSTQPGGLINTGSQENHPETQNDGEDAESPPATASASGQGDDLTGNGGETGTDVSGSADGDDTEPKTDTETVTALKERIAGITDKAELQAEYDKEQNGAKRSTALAAIEARANELNAA